jgi:hypothetical protein
LAKLQKAQPQARKEKEDGMSVQDRVAGKIKYAKILKVARRKLPNG